MITVRIVSVPEDSAFAVLISEHLMQFHTDLRVSYAGNGYMHAAASQDPHISKIRPFSGIKIPKNDGLIALVVIDQNWTNLILLSQNQQIRLELSALLTNNNPNILVLPILVQNAPMPTHRDLPPDLQLLAEVQALPLGPLPTGGVALYQFDTRIREFRETVKRLPRERGNYNLFKVASVVPAILMFSLNGIVLLEHVDLSIVDKSSIGYGLLLTLRFFAYTSTIAIWLTSTVIALVTKRHWWTLVIGVLPPISVLLILAIPLLEQLPGRLSSYSQTTLFLVQIVALLFLPIIFAQVLPPHRRKAGGL
jgi:hypothetical protein